MAERGKASVETFDHQIPHCYHCGVSVPNPIRKNLIPQSHDEEGRRKLVCYKCTSTAYYTVKAKGKKKKLVSNAPAKLIVCPENYLGCREVKGKKY